MTTPRRPEDFPGRAAATHHVWYAAYGSNMHFDRLNYYLAGGRPSGGARTYPGCRDTAPPRQMVPVLLPGQLYFALESKVWTGGMGFYDPDAAGQMAARAYLVTSSQFSDIAAQEMYEEPGRDVDLTEVLACGRAALGEGRYETLVCPGLLDGYPVLTFTAPWPTSSVTPTKPSAAYLRNIASGLWESHGWDVQEVAEYLATRPGALGAWSVAEVAEAVRSAVPPPRDE